MIVRVLRLFWRLVLLAACLTAGTFFVYYLSAWEWVRAQIAGVALVATLVLGATVVVLDRLAAMERRLARRAEALAQAVPPADRGAGVLPRPRRDGDRTTGRPADRPDLTWLASAFEPPRTHVFIPVLLGAGIAFSALAGLVERVATMFSDERAGQVRDDGPGAAVRRPTSRARWATVAGLVVLLLALVGGTINAVWVTSHYRPTFLGQGSTELTVEVGSTSRVPRPEPALTAVAEYCTLNTTIGVRVESVEPVSSSTMRLTVTPLLDEAMQLRYGGCLEDANLERYRMHVTDAVLVPAG